MPKDRNTTQVNPNIARATKPSRWWHRALIWCAFLCGSVIILLSFGVWQYTEFRTQALDRLANDLNARVGHISTSTGLMLGQTQSLDQFAERLKSTPKIVQLSVFGEVDVLWSDTSRPPAANQYKIHRSLLLTPQADQLVADVYLPSLAWYQSVIAPSEHLVEMAFKVIDRAGDTGIVMLKAQAESTLIEARWAALKSLLAATLCAFALAALALVLLPKKRQNPVQPVASVVPPESDVEKLEALLKQAKNHHKSIRTASSHAVQLNEQFLRRVGTDLHDGPSQSISYAILRLRHYQNTEAAKEIGYEYFALIESLESALEEIRGISKGLVLPELENLSLHQCLRKVVALHRSKAGDIEIDELYQDLPPHLDMGIKICAYRFVQEGLNNAIHHGQAKRVRVFAGVNRRLLTVTLKDDGMGFRVSKLEGDNSRLGILGLRDRIESIGGKFNINSVIGVGTALKLTVSLQDEDLIDENSVK